MKTRLISTLDSLRTSFWFVPTIMLVAAGLLAVAMLWIDEQVSEERLERFRWLYTGGPDAGREFLGAIASSVITVAGVVFSITVLVLSLASQQLGPRLLRTFMRDRGTQLTLGTFVATFLYCLLILRSVRKIDDEPLVPHLSISVALLLAVLSIGMLIYFIHHVSSRIQANDVIAAVAADLSEAIDTLFPRRLGAPAPPHPPPQELLPDDFDALARTVPALMAGYLQAVDTDGLMNHAKRHGLIMKLAVRPGHFVAEREELLSAYPPDRVSNEVVTELNRTFIISSQRTLTQDVEFALEQLVEVAVRALSPSLNDPFTAISCVDHLTSSLCEIAQREMPSPFRRDDEGVLRIVASPQTFASIIDTAFDQIRQHGSKHPAVAIRVFEGAKVLARCVEEPAGRRRLAEQVEALHRACRRDITEEKDLADIEARYGEAIEALREQPPTAEAQA